MGRPLWLLLAALVVSAAASAVPIEHSLDGGKSWLSAGKISVTAGVRCSGWLLGPLLC